MGTSSRRSPLAPTPTSTSRSAPTAAPVTPPPASASASRATPTTTATSRTCSPCKLPFAYPPVGAARPACRAVCASFCATCPTSTAPPAPAQSNAYVRLPHVGTHVCWGDFGLLVVDLDKNYCD